MESLANAAVAWVRPGIPALQGQLGFCPAPGRWRPFATGDEAERLEEDLAALVACGTSTLVVLLEFDEMKRTGLAALRDRAEEAGLEVLWFPIRDNTAPEDFESVALLVGRILDRLARGRTVVIHCLGGLGRSGTIAATCLVGAGRGPESALEAVRSVRPLAATGPGQEGFVLSFAAAFGSKGAKFAADVYR
ncbi:MAG TPA: hypothetical protein VLV17_00955 [Anaeromyxobacteraceae bacterium]|nr:hypothetical protein [Anaeromyxobacteraceae bacterium]